MTTEPYPGIEIDYDTHTLKVCGVPMVVACLFHDHYRQARIPPRDNCTDGLIELMEELSPGFFERVQPEMPESIHANLLCGENGWWVEMSVFPDDPQHGYAAALHCGPAHDWTPEPRTAEHLLDLWRHTCLRRDAPPDWQHDQYEPGPFAGLEPGTWLEDKTDDN